MTGARKVGPNLSAGAVAGHRAAGAPTPAAPPPCRSVSARHPTPSSAASHDARDPRLPDPELVPVESWARALAILYVGLVFLDERGAPLYANEAALRIIGQPGSDGLRDALHRAAAALAREPAEPGADGPAALRSLGDARTAAGELRLLGGRVSPADATEGGAVLLIALVPLEPAALDEAELRRRFRLTRQELRVAQLLSQGRSNRAIAGALGVSPRTARCHTEAVLRKLGVRSRAAVAATIAPAAGRLHDGGPGLGISADSRTGPAP